MNYTLKEITQACNKSELSDFDTLSILSNLPKKRSTKENSSLHKLFTHISDELNYLGVTLSYDKIASTGSLEMPYTPILVKELIWKPLQQTLLEKSTTTKLSNADIKLIFEVLEKWFAKKSIEIVFPAENEDYHNYLKRIKNRKWKQKQ